MNPIVGKEVWPLRQRAGRVFDPSERGNLSKTEGAEPMNPPDNHFVALHDCRWLGFSWILVSILIGIERLASYLLFHISL